MYRVLRFPQISLTRRFACFLTAFSTLPFIFDFGAKIVRTLGSFCSVLFSVGHLPYPRVFFFKTPVVIGLFEMKILAAQRGFCTVLGRGRVFTLPQTFFSKILDISRGFRGYYSILNLRLIVLIKGFGHGRKENNLIWHFMLIRSFLIAGYSLVIGFKACIYPSLIFFNSPMC